MVKWYEFFPSDTLFFRGAEPLDPGITHKTELLFPPPPSVIEGAVKTAVLTQQGVSIKAYSQGHAIKEKIGEYGSYGRQSPFSVMGPLLKWGHLIYVPAPFTWYTEDSPYQKKIRVNGTMPLEMRILENLGMGASTPLEEWIKHKDKLTPLGGKWLAMEALKKKPTRLDTGTQILVHPEKSVNRFAPEKRTGIEIHANRSVKEGKIYNCAHIRLAMDVSLVWGIDRDCGLEPEGVLTLGGEQRFGRYEQMEQAPEFPEQGDRFLALGPVPVSEASEQALTATGKPVYRGGWDYKRNFHKPMTPCYPPGTVFSAKIDENVIPF